jgi:serine O-acetyltransferase
MGKFSCDVKRVLNSESKKYFFVWLMDFSFWILLLFRFFSAWRKSVFNISVLRCLLEKLVEFITHVHLPSSIEAGPGLHIYHGYGLVIHGKVQIGDNVTLYHRVTIGQRFPGDHVPVVGNNVLVGAGAIILGDVYIPDDAIVPANALITPSKTSQIIYKNK